MRTLLFVSMILAGSLSLANGKNCTDYDRFSDISMNEMQKIVDQKSATIIDVNSEASFAKNRIPGAVHFSSNQENLGRVLPEDKDAMVVAYCGGKMCTAWQRAAKKACEMGYTNIRHFSEGIKGWTNKNKKS